MCDSRVKSDGSSGIFEPASQGLFARFSPERQDKSQTDPRRRSGRDSSRPHSPIEGSWYVVTADDSDLMAEHRDVIFGVL